MTAMAKHRVFLTLTLLEIGLLAGLLAQGRTAARRASAVEVPARRAVAQRLGLTDLALWTEARYTRHPSQADLFSAFQDFPSSLDHFPAGSVVVASGGLEAFQNRLTAGEGSARPCAD